MPRCSRCARSPTSAHEHGRHELGANIAEVQRLVRSWARDLGLVIDPGAERLYIVDEHGRRGRRWRRRCCCSSSSWPSRPGSGEKIVLPLTVTSKADKLAARLRCRGDAHQGVAAGPGGGLHGCRAWCSPARWAAATSSRGSCPLRRCHEPGQAARAAGAPGAARQRSRSRRYPRARLCTSTVALPVVAQGHRDAHRHRTLQREAVGDGGESASWTASRCAARDCWVQLLPDADEPVFHVYAEGADHSQSERSAQSFLDVVRTVIDENSADARGRGRGVEAGPRRARSPRRRRGRSRRPPTVQ